MIWFNFYFSYFKTLKYNLDVTGFEALAEIMQKDAFTLLAQHPDETFDYIYIAPPQYKEMWIKAIQLLDQNPDWMVEDAWVIVQIDPREYQQQELKHLSEFDQRKYGSTLLVFYERIAS